MWSLVVMLHTDCVVIVVMLYTTVWSLVVMLYTDCVVTGSNAVTDCVATGSNVVYRLCGHW